MFLWSHLRWSPKLASMATKDRRGPERVRGNFTTAVTFTDGSKQTTLAAVLQDASVSGCKVAVTGLDGSYLERLRRGEIEVEITTHDPTSGQKLAVVGKVKWAESRMDGTLLGLAYLSSHPSQLELANLLRAQHYGSNPPKRRHLAIALGVAVALVGAFWMFNRPTPVASPSSAVVPNSTVSPVKTSYAAPHQSAVISPSAASSPFGSPPGLKVELAQRDDNVEVRAQFDSFRANREFFVQMLDAESKPVLGCARKVALVPGAAKLEYDCRPVAVGTPPYVVTMQEMMREAVVADDTPSLPARTYDQ